MQKEKKNPNDVKKVEPMKKPVPVRMEDFRTGLNDLTIRSELPPYILEILLREYLTGVQTVARREYEDSRREWERACTGRENTGEGKANG